MATVSSLSSLNPLTDCVLRFSHGRNERRTTPELTHSPTDEATKGLRVSVNEVTRRGRVMHTADSECAVVVVTPSVHSVRMCVESSVGQHSATLGEVRTQTHKEGLNCMRQIGELKVKCWSIGLAVGSQRFSELIT